MDLDTPADRADFVATTRAFLTRTMPTEEVRALEHAEFSVDLDWWRQGAELGWTALLAPECAGGGSVSGDGLGDLVAVAETLGAAAAPGVLIPQSVVLAGLVASGAEAHASLIGALVSGATVATWAGHEPGAEWNPFASTSIGRRTGGGWVLDGIKDRVEAVDVANVALVTAMTDEGLAQFVVPLDAPGVQVERVWAIDFTRRFSTITFTGVELPDSALVGVPGQIDAGVERQLQVAVLLQCADNLGGAQRMFDSALEWVNNRYSFGRPLASYQALKHRFADMKMWLEACHATVSEATQAVSEGRDDAAELVSVAKAYVGLRTLSVLQECTQMFGGIGLTWEHDLHLHLRRATANRALFGTPEAHQRRLADLIAL